jgi:HPt (histidine-containing phosphotransfer) domain-containing protein
MEMTGTDVESFTMTGNGDDKVAHVSTELAELIPWFLDNRRKDIEAINTMLSTSDYKTLERLGHTLKGTCPGYGFDYLGRIGAQLETAAKAQDQDTIRRLNQDMKKYIEEVKVVYK